MQTYNDTHAQHRIHTHVHTHADIHDRHCMHTHTHTSTCVHIYACICMQTYTHHLLARHNIQNSCTHTHIYIYKNKYIHEHVHTAGNALLSLHPLRTTTASTDACVYKYMQTCTAHTYMHIHTCIHMTYIYMCVCVHSHMIDTASSSCIRMHGRHCVQHTACMHCTTHVTR